MKEPIDFSEIQLTTLAQEYSDNDKARELIESIRWPNGATCPHCKAGNPYVLKKRATSKAPCRKGLYKCRECKKQFTVTVNTIFEDSKVPLGKWAMAFFILSSSKKGVSSHQLHRMIGVTYKTAWFMTHRIRHAMNLEPDGTKLKGHVEMDEGFVGGVQKINPKTGKRFQKPAIVALVERGGNVRTKIVPKLTQSNIGGFIRENLNRVATFHTDDNPRYKSIYLPGVKHETVNHSKGEMKRDAGTHKTHVNTCESFFSLLKRGVYGSFHHVSFEHLPKYVDEFSFRWNTRKLTDGERMRQAVVLTEGKRLKYRSNDSISLT